MSSSDEPAEAIRQVEARRISTGTSPSPTVEERVGVVVEDAISVDVEGIEHYTLLCLPQDSLALVAGFLLSEGLIDSMADVAELRPCVDLDRVVRVRLKNKPPRIGDPERNLLISSACGACGGADLAARLAGLPRVGDSLSVEAATLRQASARVRARQSCFDACGGTHAAGLFDAAGEIVALAEDIGRHNALDKAIGKHLLAGAQTAGCGVVLTGRVSMEMVGKCARAGVELISAVSAPTSLAVELAERCNITLCAFVRETRATVFTHPGRVRLAGEN